MATRYDGGSKIDPELRGTVDFDFFESEDYDKNAREDEGKSPEKDEDYYYDDDDSFESDEDSKKETETKQPEKKPETKPEKPVEQPVEKPVEKTHVKPRSPSPKRSDSPTPRKSKPKRRDSVSSTESDITDVSPLTSQDTSPKQSSREPKPKTKPKQNEEGLDMEVLMDTIMKMEKDRARQQKKNVMFIPPNRDRDARDNDRNYSFEKRKMDEIERENHRLLHRILHQHQRKKVGNVSSQYALPPCKRQFHSALNRQKEQRKIEQENMRILNRLQNVKPSKEVSRDELLKETKKQGMYGIPVHTMKPRRHSDTSVRSYEETFEEGEWDGETQVSKQRSEDRIRKPRPSSGRKRPEWSDRW